MDSSLEIRRELRESEFNSILGEKLSSRALLYDLGFATDYQKVWDFQKKLAEQRILGSIPDTIVMVEHDHVLTSGRSAHSENVLVKNLPHYEIERGGDVTYHGPGQLVVYPIVSLQRRSLGIREYIEALEEVIIAALGTLGISECTGKFGPLTGVWVSNTRKIASIGVAVSHWVTYHGLALNVNTDLSYFQKIKPCGFESSIMTSVAKELKVVDVDMRNVKELVLDGFSRKFGFVFESATLPFDL
ncbi:MAG: lipoyl(octanoyl) transferase LipB [Thaumarchaeota archaeon]|nr:lipoyl(octanoyl) transferase LipB [Nitrososphaerota archaeon]